MIDERLRQQLLQLIYTSRTNPDPNARRVAADQAAMMLRDIDTVAQGRLAQGGGVRPQAEAWGPRSIRPDAQRPQAPSGSMQAPQAPTSMYQLSDIHPPIVGNFNEPMIAPSRILVVDGIPAVAPQTTSDPAKLDFTAAGGCDNGILIGMHGTVVDNTPGVEQAGNYEYGSIELQATFNDTENLITNGENATFVRYSDLFTPGDRTPFPILRTISATDSMFFQFRNTQPIDGNTLQPSLMFYFLRLDYPGLARGN